MLGLSSADESSIERVAKQQDSAPLFVSLYIVLLAFFIMLNAVASLDATKVYDVSDSVRNTFSIHRAMDETPELIENFGAELSAEQFFAQLKQTAATLLPIDAYEMYRYGNSMELHLDTSMVFERESRRIFETQLPLIQGIAKLLAGFTDKIRIDVETLVTMPQNTLALIENHSGRNLAIGRASNLSSRLIKYGSPQKATIAGIRTQAQDKVIFLFHVRDIKRSILSHAPQEAPDG